MIEHVGANQPVGVTDLSKALGLPKSTTQVYLNTLREAGFVVREETGYRLSLRFYEQGMNALRSFQLFPVARAKVYELAEETEELVAAWVEEAGEGVFAIAAGGIKAIRNDVNTGSRAELHSTSGGKAILAHLPREYVEEILQERGLTRATDATIDDSSDLWDELAEIRERGVVAGASRGDDDRLMGSASAVFDHHGDLPMKMARFVIDTHVHGQRFAVNFSEREERPDYATLSKLMWTADDADQADDDAEVVTYRNTDRLLFDMDTYGVDMVCLQPGFGFSNRLHEKMVEEHPDRFVAFAHPVETNRKAVAGEEEWDIDAACEELDEQLSKDAFVGIGEMLPFDPTIVPRAERVPWEERHDQIRKIYDVAEKHDVPVRWHPGSVNGGYEQDPSTLLPDRRDIHYAVDLHLEYPEVPIIIDHGGVQGNWRENVEESCNVAATYDNVYIEIGNYWADLIKRPFDDPNIGPEQLIWGTDWGASWIAYRNPANRTTGEYDFPPQRWTQIKSRGLQAHQADAWGSSLRQVDKFCRAEDVVADDINLMMGGNVCRLLDIEPPQKRLFPEYIR